MNRFITYIIQLFSSLLIDLRENKKFFSHPSKSTPSRKKDHPKGERLFSRIFQSSFTGLEFTKKSAPANPVNPVNPVKKSLLSTLCATLNPKPQTSNSSAPIRAIIALPNYQIIAFSSLLLIFTTPNLTAQPLSAVQPVNNSYTFSNNISFKWNPFEGAALYQLQISNNPNFLSTIVDTDTFSNTFIQISLPNTTLPYYWRVKANNNTDWGQLNTFQIFSPKLLDSLKLWLCADSVKLKYGNKVDTLYDLSGNNNYAVQSDSALSPIITNNSINNKPSIYFDGTNDLLNGTGFMGQVSEYTMCVVFKAIRYNDYGWIYRNGPSTANAFSLSAMGGNKLMYWANGASAYYTPTSCTFNTSSFSLFTITNNNLNTPKTNFYKNSTNGGTATFNVGTHSDNGYCIGSINGGAHYFQGYIPELIIYNKKHDKSIVENYLRYKYFPDSVFAPVSLGYDIKTPYGFCSKTLNAGVGYLNYQWNTGDTTEQISVNKPGSYWVRVTDIFGFQSSDTVLINYSSYPPSISDFIICGFDTAKININIGSPYTYNWSNGQTTSQFSDTQAGTYHVAITDTNMCVYRDSFNVIFDSLPSKLWLGNDTAICMGNPLGYQLLNYTPIDGLSGGYRYVWSTGDTTETTAIYATGNYALQLTNLRGCVAHDTVMVTLQGIPPTTQFTLSADSICSGDTLVFTDLTSNIVSRSWNIGEGSPQTDSTFSYVYQTPGLYTIQLTTSAANGCPKIASKTLRVNPSPTVNFTTEPACIGLPTQFTNNSIPGANDSIIQSLWNFNDPTSGIANTSSLTNPQHQFSIAGTFNPQLTVTTKKGCSTIYTQPLNVVYFATSPEPFSLVFPQANTLLVDSLVTFRWNESTNGYFYTLQIATDNQFTNIIYTSTPQKANSSSYRFTNFDTYYWRVTAQNICGNSTQSQINKLELFSPKQISGMQAWFNPDYGITSVNGKITQWKDISGLNRTATQIDTAKSPNLITNGFNNHSNIQFDGINDGLIIQDSLNINSASILSAWNGTNTIFAGYSTFLSCNNPVAGQIFFISNSGSSDFYPGCYLYSSMYINGQKTANYAPLNKYKVVGGFKLAPISYPISKSLRIGHDLSYAPWKGWIPEIILYNNPAMDSTTLAKLNDYFYSKYAPPVSLGNDIKVDYKLCDTLLNATANHFTNYLWSTGDTTGAISVSRSGSYWVQTTNIFGQVSSDTVVVYFAGKKILSDTSVCLGNSFQYNWTPLTNYTLSWSNGNVGSTFTETQAGSYSMLLTDTLGCTYRDTFNLYVDSLAMRMSLGNDTSLCSGNTLHYALTDYTLQNPHYLWNNGSTESTVQVTNPGNYWLEITNGLGCIARDTIQIGIRGNAPVVSFTAPGKCLGETTPYHDLSYSTDVSVITEWQWNFGDGESSASQHPTHQYSTPGIYQITLSVTTDSLCSNIATIPTVVYSLPQANFSPISGCSNSAIQFTNQSLTFDGYTLEGWSWNFGDLQSGTANQSQSQHPLHPFDTAGIYHITMKVISNVGCKDSTEKAIQIKASPIANFNISNTCEGETTWFSDSSIAESWNTITTRKWAFDDGYTSTLPTVYKRYENAGTYTVTYIIQSLDGCADTITKNAVVHSIPQALFTANNFCLNELITLESNSTISNDVISTIRWKVGDHHTFTQSPAQFYLDSAKTYPVQLIVSSPYQCSDTVTKTITIKPIPTAQFTYIYDENTIGYTLQFINTSTGATSYEWQSAGTIFSNEMQPTYNFGSEGYFPILMIAESTNQCLDSASANITIIRPEIDIAVSDLTLTAVGNYQQASANLINMSNRNITDLWITLQVNEQQIRERWTGMLRAGEIIPYNFRTQVYIPSGETASYSCIQIESPIVTEEINTANNQMCISLNNDFGILKLFPNPAHDYINLWLTSPSASEATIHIYSLSGTEISSWSNEPLQKGVTQLKFPLTNLSKSLYLLEVKFNNKVERVKFSVF